MSYFLFTLQPQSNNSIFKLRNLLFEICAELRPIQATLFLTRGGACRNVLRRMCRNDCWEGRQCKIDGAVFLPDDTSSSHQLEGRSTLLFGSPKMPLSFQLLGQKSVILLIFFLRSKCPVNSQSNIPNNIIQRIQSVRLYLTL